jgi:hypothetical protein
LRKERQLAKSEELSCDFVDLDRLFSIKIWIGGYGRMFKKIGQILYNLNWFCGQIYKFLSLVRGGDITSPLVEERVMTLKAKITISGGVVPGEFLYLT